MVAIGMIPGMPLFAFASLAGGTYYLSRRAQKAEKDQEALKKLGAAGQTAAADQGEKTEQETLEDLLQVDTLELEVGYGLLLIDSERGGELLQTHHLFTQAVGHGAGDYYAVRPFAG